MDNEEFFWSKRYQEEETGWDIGYPSRPLKEYIDQIQDKAVKILIPGAGNSYEAEYLHNLGFTNVFVLDISSEPLTNLNKRVPQFPKDHLIQGNFFDHKGQYDLILEQTFFCSFEPYKSRRQLYFKVMSDLLVEKGRLVGVWFKHPLDPSVDKRPFGGSKKEYIEYASKYFNIATFEECYNSIPPRAGNELFGIFVKKH